LSKALQLFGVLETPWWFPGSKADTIKIRKPHNEPPRSKLQGILAKANNHPQICLLKSLFIFPSFSPLVQ
jgi:hypothetical protein